MATASSHTEIPSTEKLTEISKIEVWDEEGKKVEFGSVYENEKTVVIFIRAFPLSARDATRLMCCCDRSFLMWSEYVRYLVKDDVLNSRQTII